MMSQARSSYLMASAKPKEKTILKGVKMMNTQITGLIVACCLVSKVLCCDMIRWRIPLVDNGATKWTVAFEWVLGRV